MKKIAFVLSALMTVTAFAAIKSIEGYDNDATYMQFTHNDAANTGNYVDGRNPGQNWIPAQTITLKIDAPSDVWISNYVSSWYWAQPLDGNVLDMGMGQYGATDINTGNTWTGTGETRTVTYTNGTNEISMDAYYLGHFNGGEELSLWMTTLPVDGAETVNMMQYVNDATVGEGAFNPTTTLQSRQDNTIDQAGNVRINLGLTTGIGREFVALGVGGTSEPPVSGQPLPGVGFASLLAMGSIAVAKKMRKRS